MLPTVLTRQPKSDFAGIGRNRCAPSPLRKKNLIMCIFKKRKDEPSKSNQISTEKLTSNWNKLKKERIPDLEEEKENLLQRLYHLQDEVRFVKEHSWRTAYYTILIYSGLIALSQIVGSTETVALILRAFFAGFALFIMYIQIRHQQDHYKSLT
jgi:hypothetical protein